MYFNSIYIQRMLLMIFNVLSNKDEGWSNRVGMEF